MKQLFIKLQNCYWINDLEYLFDFEKSNIYSIYASNWTMKTSFLKTFLDISNEKQPKDYINDVEWTFVLKDETSKDLKISSILAIESMKIDFQPKNMSFLIVNEKSKKEYNEIYSSIMSWQFEILKLLNKTSKVVKDNIISTVLKDFWHDEWNFLDFLIAILPDLETPDDLKDISYKDIFSDSKVLELLWNPDITWNIEEYDKQFQSILKEYSCYEEWLFTPFKAEILIKAIEDQQFLSVDKNWIKLWDKSFSKLWELKKEVAWSFRKIEKDAKLKAIKEKISKWTKAVKTFQNLVETKGDKIIPKLANKDQFKRDLWVYYLSLCKDEIINLLKIYNEWKSRMVEIQDEAKKEKTTWNHIVNIFEKRFTVPFKINIKDKTNVILWTKEPTLEFRFLNKNTWKYDIKKTKSELLWLKTLSWWEQRALYLLNIIFEIEIRKKKWWEHLLVIDDIADSFDYKNKYAILEYLQEIKDYLDFNIIILTHNFDFYRSLQLRLHIISWLSWNTVWQWWNLAVVRNDHKVSLIKWADLLDAINGLKSKCHQCDFRLISLIPIARNLYEYKSSQSSDEYDILTCMLHIKSNVYTIWKLKELYNQIFGFEFETSESNTTLEFIYWLCDSINIDNEDEIKLEHKIVLSIWIRLIAEELMVYRLGWDIDSVEHNSNQTRRLFDDCKSLFQIHNEWKKDEVNELNIINRVLLMTPDSIHLNSFMYEPIIDMSGECLWYLYKEIRDLYKLISQ